MRLDGKEKLVNPQDMKALSSIEDNCEFCGISNLERLRQVSKAPFLIVVRHDGIEIYSIEDSLKASLPIILSLEFLGIMKLSSFLQLLNVPSQISTISEGRSNISI